MDGQNSASLKAGGLPRGQDSEGLPIGAEPSLHNTIAAHSFLDATGYGFHFGKFGHLAIVEDSAH